MSEGRRKRSGIKLPMSRIKTIMKSSPNVETIGSDALYGVAKCTELFIQFLTVEGLRLCNSPRFLDYQGLSNFIKNRQSLNFLAEVMPKKMTVLQCKKLLCENKPVDVCNVVSEEDDSSDDSDGTSNEN